MSSSEAKPAQDNTDCDDESREAADLLAIERGEDDGMIIRLDETASAHYKRDFNVITAR